MPRWGSKAQLAMEQAMSLLTLWLLILFNYLP